MKKAPKSKAPKKSAVPMPPCDRLTVTTHAPGLAPGAAFHPGQRVTVTLARNWAHGRAGTVEVIEPNKVFVRVDGKHVAHCYAPADLAAL
jgi:hypothetical protein